MGQSVPPNVLHRTGRLRAASRRMLCMAIKKAKKTARILDRTDGGRASVAKRG